MTQVIPLPHTSTRVAVIALLAPLLRFDRRQDLTPATRLEADLAMDSLDRVSLACAIEEQFRFEISDDDVAAWSIIDDVAQTIDRALAARQGAAA